MTTPVYCKHVVAFIDHLGQRARLQRLESLPAPYETPCEVRAALRDGAGRIKLARDHFTQWFTALNSPWQKAPLHSTGDASRLTALFLGRIWPICSLVTPCQPGASPVSVRRGVSPRAVKAHPPTRDTSPLAYQRALALRSFESPQMRVGSGGASSMPPQQRNSIEINAPGEWKP